MEVFFLFLPIKGHFIPQEYTCPVVNDSYFSSTLHSQTLLYSWGTLFLSIINQHGNVSMYKQAIKNEPKKIQYSNMWKRNH